MNQQFTQNKLTSLQLLDFSSIMSRLLSIVDISFTSHDYDQFYHSISNVSFPSLNSIDLSSMLFFYVFWLIVDTQLSSSSFLQLIQLFSSTISKQLCSLHFSSIFNHKSFIDRESTDRFWFLQSLFPLQKSSFPIPPILLFCSYISSSLPLYF